MSCMVRVVVTTAVGGGGDGGRRKGGRGKAGGADGRREVTFLVGRETTAAQVLATTKQKLRIRQRGGKLVLVSGEELQDDTLASLDGPQLSLTLTSR